MMRTFTLLFAILFASNLNSQISNNLLLHYSMDGNANDISGNNNNGLSNASSTIDPFGNPNEALSFDGTTQYIDLPNNSSLKPQLPISFAFWFKLDNLNPEDNVLFTTNFDQNNYAGAFMSVNSNGFIVLAYGDNTGNVGSSNRRSKVGSTLINANVWYHAVGIINGATDMEIYLNCVNDGGTYTGTGGNLAYTTDPGSIGRSDAHASLPAYYFKGSLDEFMYWDRALTTADIDTICNNMFLSDDNNLIQEENLVSIYPNPAQNKLNIKLFNDTQVARIDIYNSAGALVSKSAFINVLDIEDLVPGLYHIQLFGSDNQVVGSQKFIKE